MSVMELRFMYRKSGSEVHTHIKSPDLGWGKAPGAGAHGFHARVLGWMPRTTLNL